MRAGLLLRSHVPSEHRSLLGRGADVPAKTSSVIPSACEISAPLRALCAMKSLFDSVARHPRNLREIPRFARNDVWGKRLDRR
jgi:hypothetical protein